MGLFSGPRVRTAAPAGVEERATYRPPGLVPMYGTFADLAVTADTAAQSVAIRTATDTIASLVSELPVVVYNGRGANRREVPVPDPVEDPGGDGMGREDWLYRLLMSWLITGNAFGDPIEVAGGRLRTVDLFSPSDVRPTIVDGKPKWYVGGREFTGQMQHWRVNAQPGRLLGLSPIEAHATTIGVSLATSRFGRQWFTDGAHPSGVLVNEIEDIDGAKAAVAKDRYQLSRGSQEPMVLGKGWTWQDVQVTPEESQFLQTQGLSEAQCARIYGPGMAEILGYETGSKMTYANVVDRRQDVLVLAVNRWVRRAERVLTLFAPRGQWVELNRDALLEATTLQRYQAHASALQNGWRTPNEIREIEHLEKWTDKGDEPVKIGASAPTQQEASDAPNAGA